MKYLLFLFFLASLSAHWEKKSYPLTTDPIDVLIPCSPKDLDTLEMCIQGIKKNGLNLGRIIVLSAKPLTAQAEWFDEALFPFTKESIAAELFPADPDGAEQFLHHPKTRIGWIYQQLLKLYAFSIIPNLSPNLLILDADVIFNRPTSFIGPQGEPLFSSSKENIQEYKDHLFRLFPPFKPPHPGKSGIVHHMLFQRPIVEDLFALLQSHHHLEPWRALLRAIDPATLYTSSMSEYEIYFNFAFLRTNQATLRPLKSYNIQEIRFFKIFSHHDFDFLTSHSWSRTVYE